MSAPLYEALLRYQAENHVRFHMPGHAGKPTAIPALSGLLPLDVTEVPGTGSLFDGLGPTRLAEEAASRCFGTAGTYLSAGGSTLCIQGMLRLACPIGSTVLMDRCVHRSALNAAALLNLRPVWLWRDSSAGDALPGRVPPEAVEKALKEHPDAAAVYLTSPDYYGVLSDVPAIADAAHAAGVPLLVDAAHGGHLAHLGQPLAPWLLGADLTACSAHKTLPALTGGAWLHVQGERWLPGAHEAMALFGSTSPSYPILLSLDLCRDWLEGEGKPALTAAAGRVAAVKQALTGRGFRLPLGKVDPLRLAVDTGCRGVTGLGAAKHLRAWGIEPEYGDSRFLVLIPGAFHTEPDFQKLQSALETLPAGGEGSAPCAPPVRPKAVMTPGEALDCLWEEVEPEKALGRISAGMHTPCPPAVPLVMPGELLDEAVLQMLTKFELSKLKVVK